MTQVCILWKAWTTLGEEVCAALLNYTTCLSPKKKTKLKNIYGKAINQFWGEWKTLNQVLFVNLRNRENILINLKIAMLTKIVELGPQH